MEKHWRYFLFLLWFAYLIISSILLFLNGFLLSRVTQENNSTCAPYSKVLCSGDKFPTANRTFGQEQYCSNERRLFSALNDISSASKICLPPKSKVILIVIDALRYDFALTDGRIKDPLPYQNKLPVINRLKNEYPHQTRLYKFIADPPTTTMQRLKALTTGSLPTFIDAGSNFATPEISEDNIIDQLVRGNQTIVFLGDDTWTGLYPERFARSFPYPSFNVWDLDTVDNGVTTNLYPEISKKDWNLIIGHFLGVDHCGHRYGPNHPEMTRKLTEMNEMIETVVDLMDDDTMLFVIGDHGMTITGDHGGSSEDEVTAALFIHSKKQLPSLIEDDDTVKQVDIVPTLSVILGVPVPFSNLGLIILNAVPVNDQVNQRFEHRFLLFHLWANVQQMVDYIKAYSSGTNTFSQNILKFYYERYASMKEKINRIKNEEDFKAFAAEASKFILDLRSICEEVWVQFDSSSMLRGLLFLFMSLFFVYIIVDGLPCNHLSEVFATSFLSSSFTAVFIAAIFSCALYYFHAVNNLLFTVFFAVCFVSQIMFALLTVQKWEVISLNWYDRSKKNRLANFFCRIVLAFNVFGVFSNSYIIEEANVLLFCLVSVIIISSLKIRNIQTKIPNRQLRWSKLKLVAMAIGIAALVRFSAYFWRCREEQQWCFLNPHESNVSAKTQTTKLQWLITVICLSLLVTITKSWLRNCGNLNGLSLTVTLAKYLPTVLVVCIAGYWVLNRFPSNVKYSLLKPWQTNILAWVAYTGSTIGISSIIIQPLCVFFKPKDKRVSLEMNERIIPQLFQQMKQWFEDKRASDNDVPVVYGLGTVYSSVFIIIGVYLTLIICLILGDAVAPSAVIMFLTAGFVLIVTSVLRIENASKIEDLFDVPNTLLLAWVVISQYFFYGTGHQPTFPNIAWEAAFVGVPGTFTNNIIPGTLVIVNTFSSFILTGFLLPLLVIMPFTVLLIMPSIVSRPNELCVDVSRGEMLLYERDNLMITNMFSLCCKYILCHGLRVFASMLSATIHCRHLMVWKIFAPKLIFESVGLLVTLAVVICSFLVLVRVNCSVNRFLVYLNKQFS